MAAESGPDREERLRKAVENYVRTVDPDHASEAPYISGFADLRDDGVEEAIVYLMDPGWCGSGGCTILVLTPRNSTYELVSTISVTWPPISVLTTKTNGWHDLGVRVAGGGTTGHNERLPFDGKTYPSSPSLLPERRLAESTVGRVVISKDNYDSEIGRFDITGVLLAQQDAWNRHDLDAFMTGYWNSPDLTFFSAGQEQHGWQATLDRYKARYQSPGHEMGKLEFSALRIEMLGTDAAFVRGEFHLTMPDGKTPHGIFTLVFRKFPDGWKIVHDHTSAAE